MTETSVVEVREIQKCFSLGLLRLPEQPAGTPPTATERTIARLPGGGKLHRRVEAVKGISFDVYENEIFGFLGPNGAGKTTTIKMLLGLIFPTRGSAKLFGQDVTEAEARRKLGFLPENPYLYQYLTALELMDLCGRLVGLDSPTRYKRTRELIERVGLGHAADRPVRKYSKGMMQRLGLAQALIGDPDLLVLDEPMTGLDPIGRKEVRDLMVEEKKKGKTLFFSSHILSDVEMLCDRVAIVHLGRMSAYGKLSELLRPDVRHVEIEVAITDETLLAKLKEKSLRADPMGKNTVFTVEGDSIADWMIDTVRASGARVVAVTPRKESLEDLFLRNALVSGG